MFNTLFRRRRMITISQLAYLSLSTINSIKTAFGDTDGEKVIAATIKYLRNMALTGQAGKDKATALAGFINEDPMMVCSLGLQVEGVTIPIRMITANDTSSYFISNITLSNANWEFGSRMMLPDVQKDLVFTGGNLGGNRFYALHVYNGRIQNVNKSGSWDISQYPYANISNNETFKVVAKINTNGTFSIKKNNDSEMSKTGGIGFVGTAYKIAIFAYLGGNGEWFPRGYGFYADGMYAKKDGVQVGNFVPYRKPSGNSYTCELLDLETMELCTRVGSFTIPDISYTPSTP